MCAGAPMRDWDSRTWSMNGLVRLSQAAAARLYGLDREAFAHVLSTFPLVDGAFRAASLAALSRLRAALLVAADTVTRPGRRKPVDEHHGDPASR